MRRISCTDQRTKTLDSLWRWRAGIFFPLAIGTVTDRRQHGERQHHQGDMAMPAVPRAGLIVVKPEFALGGLEAVLPRPAMAFHRNQDLNRGTGRAPSREIRQLAIADSAPDQQAAGPPTAAMTIKFCRFAVGQFEIRPVIPDLNSARLQLIEIAVIIQLAQRL